MKQDRLNMIEQENINNSIQQNGIGQENNVDNVEGNGSKGFYRNKFLIFVAGMVVVVLWLWVVLEITQNKHKRKYEDIMDENGGYKENNILLDNVNYQGQRLQTQQNQLSESDYFHFKPKFQGYKLLQKPRVSITPPKDDEIDRYQLNYDIQTIQKRFSVGRTRHVSINTVICHQKFNKFILGVRLAEVTNNINYFGEVQMENYEYYKTPKDKYQKIVKTLMKEKQYVEKKYQISKYIHKQIGFCVVIASRNNAKTRIYLRNLNSIFQQEYDNYHVVYFDDASTDNLSYYVKEYIKSNRIPQDKIRLITNQVRKGGLDSFYKAAHEYCQPGQVMTFIDGDDCLIGRQVFSLLNAVYQKQKVGMTYGSNFQFDGFQFYQVQESYRFPNVQYRMKQNLNYDKKGLQLMHMRTAYVDIFRMIDKARFQYKNGSYLTQTTDVASYEPLSQLAGARIKLIQQLIYQRSVFIATTDNFGNQKPKQQTRKRIKQLLNLSPQQRYKPLKQMKFADNPKTRHYEFK